jgi:hypothetical protein
MAFSETIIGKMFIGEMTPSVKHLFGEMIVDEQYPNGFHYN